MFTEILSLVSTDTIQSTGVGAAIGLSVSGFWSHMNKRLKQPVIDAEADRIRAEAELMATQTSKELAELLREEMKAHIELMSDASQKSIETLSGRVNQLEATNHRLLDEISALKSRNHTLEEDNKRISEKLKQLKEK